MKNTQAINVKAGNAIATGSVTVSDSMPGVPCPGPAGYKYVGARYVPLFADPAEWNINSTYEPLTIVLNEGNSYTSKQYVPVGIQIDNEEYWALTGNYNAQVEQYRQEVKELMETTVRSFTSVAEMIEYEAQNGDTLFVEGYYNSGDGGACYYTVSEAASGYAHELTNGLYANAVNPNNIRQFGAKGDRATDDTAAIQAAFDYADYYLHIPEGTYMTTATINLSRCICVYGDGVKSAIIANVASNTAALHFEKGGKQDVINSALKLMNFAILPPDATPNSPGSGIMGGNVLELEVNEAASWVYHLEIGYMVIGAFKGDALTLKVKDGIMDGFGLVNIHDNHSYNGGWVFSNFGDSNYIVRNSISGSGKFTMSNVSGASCYNITSNNITIDGGLTITNCPETVIENNQFEMVKATTNDNNAIISLTGGYQCSIKNNNLNTHQNAAYCIYNAKNYVTIEGNLFRNNSYYVKNTGSYVNFINNTFIKTASGTEREDLHPSIDSTGYIINWPDVPSSFGAKIDSTSLFNFYSDSQIIHLYGTLKGVSNPSLSAGDVIVNFPTSWPSSDSTQLIAATCQIVGGTFDTVMLQVTGNKIISYGTKENVIAIYLNGQGFVGLKHNDA